MCIFITTLIDSSVDPTKIKEVAQKNGLGWWEIENKSLSYVGGIKKRVFLTAKDDCDCNTALGSAHHHRKSDDIDGEIKKLKRKGWSQSKIDRWRKQKETSSAKKTAGVELKVQEELSIWTNFLNESLKQKCISNISLLIHCYSGDQHEEVLKISETSSHKLGQDIKDFLLNLEQDKIYKIS